MVGLADVHPSQGHSTNPSEEPEAVFTSYVDRTDAGTDFYFTGIIKHRKSDGECLCGARHQLCQGVVGSTPAETN